FFIAYQPAQDLLWRVAERGMLAAHDSEDMHAIRVAPCSVAQAHRAAGDWDAADVGTVHTLQLLEGHTANKPVGVTAIHGALLFEDGYTSARRGEIGTAWGRWDAANSVAARLPDDYFHPVTSFSRTVMGAHAVTIAVELRAGGESVRQAS